MKITSTAPTYEETKRKRTKEYAEEMRDLLAKIRGSSLKTADKEELMQYLHKMVADNVTNRHT